MFRQLLMIPVITVLPMLFTCVAQPEAEALQLAERLVRLLTGSVSSSHKEGSAASCISPQGIRGLLLCTGHVAPQLSHLVAEASQGAVLLLGSLGPRAVRASAAMCGVWPLPTDALLAQRGSPSDPHSMAATATADGVRWALHAQVGHRSSVYLHAD